MPAARVAEGKANGEAETDQSGDERSDRNRGQPFLAHQDDHEADQQWMDEIDEDHQVDRQVVDGTEIAIEHDGIGQPHGQGDDHGPSCYP